MNILTASHFYLEKTTKEQNKYILQMVYLLVAKAAVPWLWASHIPTPTAQPSEALAVIKKSQPQR